MSLNLFFSAKNGVGSVDFPFQTPTELTLAVIKEDDNKKKIKMLVKHMKGSQWDKATITLKKRQIQNLMNDPRLELTLI